MADFSKLSNLFNAKQSLKAYKDYKKGKKTITNKNKADVNHDGKVNSKDLKIIEKRIKASSTSKRFDFTGDKKVTIDDWNEFNAEMDLDGNGKVSKEEKAFLASQKRILANKIKAQIRKDKYTGEFDGKYYKDGKLFTGTKDGVKYVSGVPQSTPAAGAHDSSNAQRAWSI